MMWIPRESLPAPSVLQSILNNNAPSTFVFYSCSADSDIWKVKLILIEPIEGFYKYSAD